MGTTITALLAALAASEPEALTVGLAHTTFNLLGIFLLYVLPFFRDVPILAAEKLADFGVERRSILSGLLIILVALTFITKNMRRLVADRVERSLNAILGRGGGAEPSQRPPFMTSSTFSRSRSFCPSRSSQVSCRESPRQFRSNS